MILNILFFFLSAFSLSVLVNSVYNFFTAPEVSPQANELNEDAKVSILIPARNEEKSIIRCLESAADQSYKNIEIIVYDDQSEDGTKNIVEKFAQNRSDVILIEGVDLRSGWTGKNWACHNLSKSATGDFYLFMDADVFIKQDAVKNALNIFIKRKASLLSVFPTQELKTFGEKLIVPLMNWLLLSFLPLRNVYGSKSDSLLAANGQFILIPKEIYSGIGGHEKVKRHIVEDMELARLVKKKYSKVITVLGGADIYCRMYDGFESAFSGFSKNFYRGFKTSPAVYFIILLFFEAVFLLPFFFVFVNFKFIFVVLIVLMSRILISWKSKQNIFWNVVLHPIQIIILFILGVNSVWRSYFGKIFWKGRRI